LGRPRSGPPLLLAGAGCCTPRTLTAFDGLPGGSFAPRRSIALDFPPGHGPIRAVPRPTLIDWDRDGQADVLVCYVGLRSRDGLYVASGPLTGRTELAVRPVDGVPGDPYLVHVAAADWDGDGRFDLLAAVTAEGDPLGHGSREIVWYRNRSAVGVPVFEGARPVLRLPEPWRIDGFAAWAPRPGAPAGLVVGVNSGENWVENGRRDRPLVRQLWRFRRQ
jgi:hypothetical protein